MVVHYLIQETQLFDSPQAIFRSVVLERQNVTAHTHTLTFWQTCWLKKTVRKFQQFDFFASFVADGTFDSSKPKRMASSLTRLSERNHVSCNAVINANDFTTCAHITSQLFLFVAVPCWEQRFSTYRTTTIIQQTKTNNKQYNPLPLSWSFLLRIVWTEKIMSAWNLQWRSQTLPQNYE